MQHTVAAAIRAVGEKICRRLDVLIEAAHKPPVQDIEGTTAPRKPLAACALAMQESSTPATSSGKKRGRPPKTPAITTPKAGGAEDSAEEAEESDHGATPADTVQVLSLFCRVCLFLAFLRPLDCLLQDTRPLLFDSRTIGA